MVRKKASTYRSSLSDNVRPGSPTTMDVLLGWLTTPGNLKRWRTGPRAQLAREIVEMMQEEGLAHRKAPYVTYKVNAIEKQYLQAKQWLLETGMHEPYLTGKASKEVRAHVEHLCPWFKKLDPSLRGVPFSKKNAETIEIELDDDSVGEEKHEEEKEEKSENEEQSESEEDREESEEESDAEEESEAEEESGSEEEQETRTAFRDKLLAQKKNNVSKKKSSVVIEEKPKKKRAVMTEEKKKKKKSPVITEEQPKQPATFRNRLLGVKETAVEKKPASPAEPKKKVSRLARQIEPSAGYAAARKSLTTEEQTEAIEELVPSSIKISPAKEKPSTAVASRKKSPARGNRLETAVQAAMMEVAPSAPKRKGRPPKSATASIKTGEKETAQRANAKKKTATLQTNGNNQVSQKVSQATSTKDQAASKTSQMTRGKTPTASPVASDKGQTVPSPAATSPAAPKASLAASDTSQAAPKSMVTKRKSSAEELLLVKRARTEEEVAANTKEVMEIERRALLKRVDDEEQQRHEMHELERAKLKCELESKQIQLLFEKAAARKKLDQLGVPQEEIDRILPL